MRWGSPVEAIVDYAKEQEIDLIVIATHGRTGSPTSCSARSPSGSSASALPVLTLRDSHRTAKTGV